MKVAFDINGRNVVRWLVGALLVWAAVSKLPNLQEFYGALAGYRLPLPGAAVRFAAEILPWLELFCGLLLLSRLWYRPALVWFLILCVVFLASTGEAWARGLHISCGCMNLDFLKLGELGDGATKVLESAPFAFGRAVLLLAAGWFLYCGEQNRSWPLYRPAKPAGS
jgi:putative oxidoreductase